METATTRWNKKKNKRKINKRLNCTGMIALSKEFMR